MHDVSLICWEIHDDIGYHQFRESVYLGRVPEAHPRFVEEDIFQPRGIFNALSMEDSILSCKDHGTVGTLSARDVSLL